MDSIYYCFLCGAEFNTSEEWNAHLNVSFFYFPLLIYCLNLCLKTLINVYIFCIEFSFVLFSHIFILIALLSNFFFCIDLMRHFCEIFFVLQTLLNILFALLSDCLITRDTNFYSIFLHDFYNLDQTLEFIMLRPY